MKTLLVILLASLSAQAQLSKDSCLDIKHVLKYYSSGISCKDTYEQLSQSNTLESRTVNWPSDVVRFCDSGNLSQKEIDAYRERLRNKIDAMTPPEAYEYQKSFKNLLAGALTIGMKPYSGDMRNPFILSLNCTNEHSFVRKLGKFTSAAQCTECYKNKDCEKLKEFRPLFAEVIKMTRDTAPDIQASIEKNFPKFCKKIFATGNYGSDIGGLYEACSEAKPDERKNLDNAYINTMVEAKEVQVKAFNKIFEKEEICKYEVFQQPKTAPAKKSDNSSDAPAQN